jgi:predicted transcriptional regulator
MRTTSVRCGIVTVVVMPTSIHLPKPLLAAVDRRARALRVSRSRWIVLALQRELEGGGGWSDGFFDRLAETDGATRAAVDELRSAVVRSRTSKRAPTL